jgi:dTDP-4-amino-4,6-dideoxygalactose transaminase
LPRTDAIADRILTLPLYPGLSDQLLELVADSLIEAVSNLAGNRTSSARPK